MEVGIGIDFTLLVIGLTQLIKEAFNLEGKAASLVTVGVGFVIMAGYQVGQFLPDNYGKIYNAIMYSLAFALAANGNYKFVRSMIDRSGQVQAQAAIAANRQ